jgi:hypothetical protein
MPRLVFRNGVEVDVAADRVDSLLANGFTKPKATAAKKTAAKKAAAKKSK